MTQSAGALLPDPMTRPTLPVWPDTGQILGLSKSATYEGIRTGEIPSIRIGRRILVPTAALRRMLCMGDERQREAVE